MAPAKLAVLLAFVLVLSLPFFVRSTDPAAGADASDAPGADAPTLVIITPHIEQIRSEFEWAFDRWHAQHYGERVRIDWRTPGGTTEIIRLLEAQYEAAVRDGRITFDHSGRPSCPPGTVDFDLVFGGGSYEHTKLKRGVSIRLAEDAGGGQVLSVPMSVPAGFTQAQLDEWYGENAVGAQLLYEPDQHWLGAALSGFGIVFNRDVLEKLALPEPASFEDLADPRYAGMLALADPRQSGSVATTYESILNKKGWDGGWRLLRELCANARYFASSSVRPPIDVSQGDAAAGLAIDFYGRGQAQVVMRPGDTAETCRVGYVDPEGSVYIDADPVSILLGAPRPELARRFVAFCLSEEGQALWQFPARESSSAPDGGAPPLGPRRYELRRMPVRRLMYEKHLPYFIDKANPFELASRTTPRGWRDAIAPMMTAFGIDTAEELRAAWNALNRARADPGFPPERLREMEDLFYAMPEHTQAGQDGPGGSLSFSEENYRAIAHDTGRWRDPVKGPRSRIACTEFFKRTYRRVAELGMD